MSDNNRLYDPIYSYSVEGHNAGKQSKTFPEVLNKKLYQFIQSGNFFECEKVIGCNADSGIS